MHTAKCLTTSIDYQAIQTALDNHQIKADKNGGVFLTKEGRLVVSVMGDKVASFCRSRLGFFKAGELYTAFRQWKITQAPTCEPRVAPKKDAAKDEGRVLEQIVTPGACGFTGDAAETATVLFPQSAEKTSLPPIGVSGYNLGGTFIKFAGEERVLPDNPHALMEIEGFFPSDGYFMIIGYFEEKNRELCRLLQSVQFRKKHYKDIKDINSHIAIPESYFSDCLCLMYDRKDTKVLIEPLINTFNKATTQSEKEAIAGELVNLVKNYAEKSNKFTSHLTMANEPKPFKRVDSDAEKSHTELMSTGIGLPRLDQMLTALNQYRNKMPSDSKIYEIMDLDNGDSGTRMMSLERGLFKEFAKPGGVRDDMDEFEKALESLMSGPFINLKTGSVFIPAMVFQRPDGPDLFINYCKQLIVLHEQKYSNYTEASSFKLIDAMKNAIKTMVGFKTLLKECDSIARGVTVDQATLKSGYGQIDF
ncbi:hypothetical protein [Candidatus Sororendozoicomonas aggregata]|uniref:hypothetical protein n=1 Tax=Candidatus Sororendozoicomonas aggregata TaxID=3073239 RepID=UPI002ED126E2